MQCCSTLKLQFTILHADLTVASCHSFLNKTFILSLRWQFLLFLLTVAVSSIVATLYWPSITTFVSVNHWLIVCCNNCGQILPLVRRRRGSAKKIGWLVKFAQLVHSDRPLAVHSDQSVRFKIVYAIVVAPRISHHIIARMAGAIIEFRVKQSVAAISVVRTRGRVLRDLQDVAILFPCCLVAVSVSIGGSQIHSRLFSFTPWVIHI